MVVGCGGWWGKVGQPGARYKIRTLFLEFGSLSSHDNDTYRLICLGNKKEMEMSTKRKPESFNVRIYVNANGKPTLGFVLRSKFVRKIGNSHYTWMRGNRRKMARLLGVSLNKD
jgi:hypothetical protein